MTKQIANVTILSASDTLKAASTYKGAKAQKRRDAIIQVYMSSAFHYVDTADVKHLNNILAVSADNGQVRAAKSLVHAVAFHAFDKEHSCFKAGKLDKKQKTKRDKIAENIDGIIEAWFKGELKASKPAAFNPETRFRSLLKQMMQKGNMTADEAKEFILGNLDKELKEVAGLEA